MTTVDNSRPPYVAFERRAMEDRNASIAAGHYVAKDVDFAIITRPGSRDSRDKNAVEWLKELAEKARQGTVPLDWSRGFNEAYKAWKEGQTIPENGTPIKGWPVLSPATQETIIAVGFRTVEDLAQADETSLVRIGTGAMSIRLKAQAWLENASGNGKAVEKIAELAEKVASLSTLTEQLVAENKKLRAQLPLSAVGTTKG